MALSIDIKNCPILIGINVIFFLGIVHLNGFGASFPYDVYKEWLDRYRVYREPYVYLDMDYISTGSGTGIALITG